MRWLETWRGLHQGRKGGERCQDCRHFSSDPAALEAALPGLAILSSAHASVRSGDGLCLFHDRLIDGGRRCASFAQAVA
jgi:predicted adenine nucleotide alpha hydrolase (AANH) superfamily ATPase